MERSEHTSAWTHVCTSVWTNAAPDRPQDDEYRRLLTIILVSIFSGTVLIALLAVAVVLLRRYCIHRPAKSTAASNNNTMDARTVTNRPRVVYGSKRFAKEHGGAVEKPRTASSEQGNRVSTAFTPQERATILAMLADTRVSGGPRAYANAAYDPGSLEFAGEANGHVYDAIPGDQVFDEPLDSPV